MSNEDVERAVITPMRSAFPAPTHVRGNPASIEALLDVYRKALARFDRETLEQAWQQVASAQTFWLWPMPEAIVKAADAIHNRTHQKPADPDAWVEKAQELADAAVRRFMKTSAYAARAREGGYEAKMKRYVAAVAWVQAQMITRQSSGVGYDHRALFGNGERDKEADQEFFEKCREQAATGTIKVTVSREIVAAWKAEAATRSRAR